MGLCSFNDIGDFLSASSETGDSAQYKVDLPPDDILVKEGIFRKDGNTFVFARKGLEAFVARRFSCPELVHSGNVCCFGTVDGRTLYYSAAPRPNFFNMHGAEASIIIGSNSADIPAGWKGRAVLLSALFTVKDGKIVVVKSGMKAIFPGSGEPKNTKGSKKPHARRRFWLEYLCDYLATRQQKYGVLSGQPSRTSRKVPQVKYDPKDFTRPKPKDVLAWFTANTSLTLITDQTPRRDIKAFTVFDPKKDKTQVYDKRDELIAAIWKNIDNPEFVLNPKTLKAINDEMARLKAPRLGILAETAAIAKSAFEDNADANGRNSSPTIAVDSDLDVDKTI